MPVAGKGRGRGALKTITMPGMLEKSSRGSGDGQEKRSSQLSPPPSELYEARVTEILDCSTFWAQIGTAASLEQFDSHCAALNGWCLENNAVRKSLPKVNDIVAVLEKESGTWVRARVTRQLSDSHIELFYIDSGSSGRVALDSICANSSPLLYQCPAQALQCILRGVQLLDTEDSWSEEAVSRFTELVKGAAKIHAWNHPAGSSYDDAGANYCSVTLYIIYEERWTSVGEILAREKLAKYTPPGPVYLRATPSVLQRLVPPRNDGSSVPTEPTSEEESSSSTVAELQELVDKRLSDLGVDTPPPQESAAAHSSLKLPKTPPLDELDPTPVPSEEGVRGGERKGEGEERSGGEERSRGEEGSGGGSDGEKAAEEEPVLKEMAAVEKQDKEKESQLSGLDDLINTASLETAVPRTEPLEAATGSAKTAAKTAAVVDAKVAVSELEEKTKSGLDPHLNDSDSQSDDSWDWSLFPSRRANGPSGSSEASLDSPYKVDPFAPKEEDAGRRRKARMQAQYDAIMAEGTVLGRFQHGRKKHYNRRQGGQDHAPYQQGPSDYHGGGAESEGGERGEWSKWGGGPQARRFRLTGGAGRGHSRSDMSQEGVPGAMRGVRINRLPRDQQFAGERGRGFGGGRGTRLPPRFKKQHQPASSTHLSADPAHLPADSAHPPPITNEQPVELFDSKPRVITGMTQGETKNEIDWHVWKIKQKMKKLLETLSSSSAAMLGSEVKKLLEDSSGQKLSTLPSSKGPLWHILESVVFGAIGKPSEYIDSVVVGIESIHSVASQGVCQLLQPALEGLAHDVCEGSAATDAQKNRHSFCSLVGKLLIKTSYSDKEEFSTAVGRIVRQFLNTWSQCAPGQSELQSIAFADCFAALSEEIGPTIDITNKSTLDAYFDGAIKEHILAAKLPRSVRERLLEVSLKRAGGWGGATNQPHPQPRPKSQANTVPTATESQQLQQQQQQGPQPAFQSVGTIQQYAVQQPSVLPSSPPFFQPSAQTNQHLPYPHQNLYQPATSSQAAQQPSQPLQSPAIAPALQQPFQTPTFMVTRHSSESLQSPTYSPAPHQPSYPLQSSTVTPALQHPPHPLQSPTVTPALQHPPHPLQSPTVTLGPQHPPHPLQSPAVTPALQHPPHPLQSPTFTPAIQQYSTRPLHSPTFSPALQYPAHPLQQPSPAPTPQPAVISHSHPLPSPPVPVATAPQSLEHAGNNPYGRVEEMLSALGLLDLLEMCKQAMIKDSVLDCKRDELKLGLKEAGLPVGAIIAIADYLEKSRHQRTSGSSTHSLPPTLPPTPVPLSPVEQQSPQMAAAPGPPTQGFPPTQPNAGQYGISFVSQQLPPQTGSNYSAPQYQYTADASQFEVGQAHTYLRPAWTSPVQQLSKDSAPPTTAVTMGTSEGKPQGGSYGFGRIRCVVCGSQEHKSEDCSERSSRFFL